MGLRGSPTGTHSLTLPLVTRSFDLRLTTFGEAEVQVELVRMEQLEESLEEKYRVDEESRPVKREIDEVYDNTRNQPLRRPAKRSRLASGREVQFVDLAGD
ncbi:hypothetical protein DL766_010030 [Monosporascus sp. MC13-8B]|uniref:Uncharacterized protein n=1 Tax=Monosporascus cannonballus TaxID=155416 RepID=A0ABY0H8U8_9PEZI|nr:hypothetical protein DL763_008718 [Monosporascus cannonballus]RYO87779.1 hypothetical protein DL762_004069 [Monosporascus cannonballus]RYP11605.1 hypothetical protein DL766_010030 [Monosporascus sp. MC13-8B]